MNAGYLDRRLRLFKYLRSRLGSNFVNKEVGLRSKLVLSLTLLTTIAVAIVIGAVTTLYNSAIDVEKQRLLKIVDRQVYILEVISLHDSQSIDSEEYIPLTLKEVIESIFSSEIEENDNSLPVGDSELVVGMKNGDNIKFFGSKQNKVGNEGETMFSRAVPWKSNLAEPLRMALQGEKGTMIGLDYLGRTILAAYAPSKDNQWGIVAKVDIAEVQRPFVLVTMFAALGIAVILLLGYALFRQLSHPFIERTKVEEALVESREQMGVILDNTADGIISMKADGTILTFNRAAEKMFRYSAQEVLGKNITVLMTSFDSDRHSGYVDGYLETRTKKIIGIGPREVNGVRKDGSLIPIDLAVNEFKSKEGVLFVGSVRDISERIIQRKKIQRSQKIEAIGQLTRGVATDFNNILINIQDKLNLLEGKHGSDSETAGYIHNASKAAKHGMEMIQRLLAFSRRQQLTPESIDIKAVIADTVKLAKPSLGESVKVSLDVSRDLWSIVADKSQLENTLLSLCLNSRDAMPSGGNLDIKADNLSLDKDGANKYSIMPGEYIRISVKDDGMGISASVVDKVFQPFFTTKDFGKGSGLGLSIIQSFVHQAGGTVSLHSEVDKGTEVEILLPRQGQSSLSA